MGAQITGPRRAARRSTPQAEPEVGSGVYVAAALSLISALIYLWAAPRYFLEWDGLRWWGHGWWGYGAFYLTVCAAQGLYSVLLLRWPSQLMFLAGILGHLAVIGVSVVTHTWGVPFGPYAGHVEAVKTLDMLATAAQLVAAVALLAMMGSRRRETLTSALLILGAVMWGARLLGVLT